MTDNIARSSLDFIKKQNSRQRTKNIVVDVESPLMPKNLKNVPKLLWIHGKSKADIPQDRPKKPGVAAVQNIEPPFQNVFGIKNSASSAWSTLSSNYGPPRRVPSQRQFYKPSSGLFNVDKSFTVVDVSLDGSPTNTVSPNIVFELKQIEKQSAHNSRRISYSSDCQTEQHRPSECIDSDSDAEIIEYSEPVDGGLITKTLRVVEDCAGEKTMTSSPESDQEEFGDNEEFEITVLNGRKPEVKKFVL